MNNPTALIEQARKITAARTTAQLVTDWTVADSVDTTDMSTDDYMAISQMRGWIMDELEIRDADAFAAWCDTPEMDNDSLQRLFANVA